MPTRKLIVTGLYRHVRNPTYVAVLSLIFGQALLWADALVLAYRALIAAGFHLFVSFYEEPTLMRVFCSRVHDVPGKCPSLHPSPDSLEA